MGWTRALGAVASVSDAEAVEGMKAMCHEIMGVAGDAATLAAMAPDVDRLVGLLAKRISPIFDAAAVAPGPSTARACKYVLNTLMQVFQEPALASAVGEANERMIVAALLERLLDAAVPRMEEGPQLVKALNVLMLKVLEHCPRTSSFRALLRLLATPPESVADDEATTARFNELVVKCLIKLTKALGATLHEVRLPELLQEIHGYFDALGTEEIRRRGRASDGGDKPLGMVKTILHKVTEIVGHDVYDSMGLCPPRDADPAPIIYAYVELNLQSMPDAPGVPRHFEPLAKPRCPKRRRRRRRSRRRRRRSRRRRRRSLRPRPRRRRIPRSACGASHAGTLSPRRRPPRLSRGRPRAPSSGFARQTRWRRSGCARRRTRRDDRGDSGAAAAEGADAGARDDTRGDDGGRGW